MASQRVSPASYSIYAPLRYEATRPFSVKLGEQYQRFANLGLTARNRHLIHDIAPGMRKAMKVAGKPIGENAILSELSNFLAFGEFLKGGRIIYDFHKKLTSALLSTDVDEMPVSALPKPADSLYIHFGDIEHLSAECSNIEGAFVSWRSVPGETETLNISLATKNHFAKPYYWLDSNLELSNGSMLDISDKSCNIIDCMQKHWDLVRSNYVEDMAAEGVEISEDVEIGNQPMMMEMKHGVKLVVKCLLFLAAVTDDITEEWDDRAPSDLVHQAKNAEKDGSRKTAERTLSNRDYLKIRFIGRKFAEIHEKSSHTDIGKKKITHLRRGHFRNQPYGPERCFSKVIFIPPMVINSDSGEELGRIYQA